MPQYAILDIETTGLSPASEKITEIAIFIHDGKQIVDEFVSLINPERKIPYRIIQMTGINNQMVEHAPKFFEVAKQLVEILTDKIIVGHNVRFDFGFIRSEFKSLGYDFQSQTLDTIKLSRKLIPGRRSYGLGNLCKDLEIENSARHRAAGDAMATVKLFELLLSIEENIESVDVKGAQSDMSKSLVYELPKKTGVYYFYNKRAELIYVGKSVNIHDRVLSHLNNNLHKKAVEMKEAIANVSYEVTGSELLALLLESSEIKKHQPFYNRAQRRTFFNYGLYDFTDEKGFLNIRVARIVPERMPIYTYGSLQEGKQHLERLVEEFNLCQKLCGLYDTQGACFHYQIHQCEGACVDKEVPEDYNKRVEDALENYHFEHQNFFVIDVGREADERSVVKVAHGKYMGYGFVDLSQISNHMEALHDCIRQKKDNKEVRQIIKSFISRNQVELIYYP